MTQARRLSPSGHHDETPRGEASASQNVAANGTDAAHHDTGAPSGTTSRILAPVDVQASPSPSTTPSSPTLASSGPNEFTPAPPKRRGRGRPPGSRNKPKLKEPLEVGPPSTRRATRSAHARAVAAYADLPEFGSDQDTFSGRRHQAKDAGGELNVQKPRQAAATGGGRKRLWAEKGKGRLVEPTEPMEPKEPIERIEGAWRLPQGYTREPAKEPSPRPDSATGPSAPTRPRGLASAIATAAAEAAQQPSPPLTDLASPAPIATPSSAHPKPPLETEEDIAEFAEEFRAALKETTGVGRHIEKGPKPYRGTLSEAYKDALGSAQMAIAEGRLTDARAALRDITLHWPDFPQGWLALGAVEEEMGNVNAALKLFFVAGHLAPSNEVTWTTIARLSRRAGNLNEAIYCYAKVAQCRDPDPVVLWERAVLLEELGHIPAAGRAYVGLLALYPGNMALARFATRLALAHGETAKATEIYSNVLNHFVQGNPVLGFPFQIAESANVRTALTLEEPRFSMAPTDAMERTAEECNDRFREPTAEEEMSWDDINVISEVVLMGTGVDESVFENVKRAVLRLQGREVEARERLPADDKEFDDDDLADGHDNAAMDAGRGLPLQIRIKLGRFRLAVAHPSLALANKHFKYLEKTAPTIRLYESLWTEVVDAFIAFELYESALRYLVTLVTECTTGVNVLKLAQCYLGLGHAEEAEKKYLQAFEMDNRITVAMERVAELREARGDFAGAAAALGQIVGVHGLKAQYVDEFPAQPVRADATPPPVPAEMPMETSAAAEPQEPSPDVDRQMREPTPQPDTLRLLKDTEDTDGVMRDFGYRAKKVTNARRTAAKFEEIDTRFRRVRNLEKALDSSSTSSSSPSICDGRHDLLVEYIKACEDLFDVFLNSHFSSRNGSFPIEGVYAGIELTVWLSWAKRYVEALWELGAKEQLMEVLKMLTMPSYFGCCEEAMETLLRKSLSYLIRLDASERLQRVKRDLLLNHSYSNDAYRIFLGFRSRTSLFADSILQKFLRHTSLVRFGDRKRQKLVLSPEEHSSFFFATIARAHQSASCGTVATAAEAAVMCISRYPRDPHLYLIAAGYLVQRAVQRTSSNRHYQILCALSLLKRYKALRLEQSEEYKQEVAYNCARWYHHIGLYHLAVPLYEECLATPPARWVDGERGGVRESDLSRNAAHNLVHFYFQSGNSGKARKVMQQYLVF